MSLWTTLLKVSSLFAEIVGDVGGVSVDCSTDLFTVEVAASSHNLITSRWSGFFIDAVLLGGGGGFLRFLCDGVEIKDVVIASAAAANNLSSADGGLSSIILWVVRFRGKVQ